MSFIKSFTQNPIKLLRVSIGIIYFWFGLLKFFYGLSPAEHIASETIGRLTFHLIPGHEAITVLALWECGIGISLMICKWMRVSLILLFVHMVLTFMPFLFFPHQVFMRTPYGFTLLGQYIMKNIIIISGGLVLWQYYVADAFSTEIKPQLK